MNEDDTNEGDEFQNSLREEADKEMQRLNNNKLKQNNNMLSPLDEEERMILEGMRSQN